MDSSKLAADSTGALFKPTSERSVQVTATGSLPQILE
jgi:hypothetical protein